MVVEQYSPALAARLDLIDSDLTSHTWGMTVVRPNIPTSLQFVGSALQTAFTLKEKEVQISPDAKTIFNNFFFSDVYVHASPAERSKMMQGNHLLASAVALWWNGLHAQEMPSHTSPELMRQLASEEVGEVDELITSPTIVSLCADPLPRAWFRDPRAHEAWEVGAEIADMAFYSLSYWGVYDRLSPHKMETLMHDSHGIFGALQQLPTQELVNIVHMMAVPGTIERVQSAWPEYLYGLAHLLSDRMGFDLPELLILKAFANERHYPSTLRMVEPGQDWVVNAKRSPARVFMQNMRKSISPDHRFIPPSSDPIIGETVLDVLYRDHSCDDALDISSLNLIT